MPPHHEASRWPPFVQLAAFANALPRWFSAACGQFVAAWGIGLYAEATTPPPAQSDWYYWGQIAVAISGTVTAGSGVIVAWVNREAKKAKQTAENNTGAIGNLELMVRGLVIDVGIQKAMFERYIMREGYPGQELMQPPVKPPLNIEPRHTEHCDADQGGQEDGREHPGSGG